MTKRSAALAVLAPVVVVLGSAPAVWVSGTTSDPVLGASAVTATGTQASPGTVALTAVVAAALLGVLTSGRRLRVVATALLVAAAVGALVLVASVARAPADALGRRAAEQVGRVGSVAADARTTGWLWLGLVGAVALVGAAVVVAWAARGWGGLSQRFDRPTGERTGAPGALSSSWDALSAGGDPTADTPADPTADIPREGT